MNNKLNPFTPAYGSEPLYFAERNGVINEFLFGLENGPGDPNRSTILTGPRGMGKTVTLHEIKSKALEHGWVTVYTVASSMLLDSILRKLKEVTDEHINKKSESRITSVTFGGFSITREYINSDQETWEEKFTKIIQQLSERSIGVIVQIDEVRANLEEMRRFAILFQEFISRKYKVALVMAGLPHEINLLFNDKVISFIRRSRKKQITQIGNSEVIFAMRKTFQAAGKNVEDGSLEIAATSIGGYPYLLQLIGYEIWQASDNAETISSKDVLVGIENSKKYIGSSMVELVFQDLTNKERDFVFAMCQDDGASKTVDIAQRLHVGVNYISEYRRRLIDAGIIVSNQRGEVDFIIPFFKEYIKNNYS
jgi:chromosomal replication initiation ATPase DnaA